jgi:hypothetical protein
VSKGTVPTVLVLALLLGFIMLAIYRKNLDKKDEKDRE